MYIAIDSTREGIENVESYRWFPRSAFRCDRMLSWICKWHWRCYLTTVVSRTIPCIR